MSRLAASTPTLARLIALTVFVFGLATFSAHAAEDFYNFKSVLSSPQASWCMDVPEYQSGAHTAIAGCGKPSQTFGFESGGTLSAGGFCLDGLTATPGKSPGAGDPVVVAECDGSNHQAWELQPFKNRQDVFAIANPDELCVTVDGTTIGEGTPLVLAQCAELDTQGWVRNQTASAAPEYYTYSGHRYCWYDAGWHGGGWYWCNENLHQGVGWGGPIGWHWWHHHGHPPHPHPVPHPHPHPMPGPHPQPGPHPHPQPGPHPHPQPGPHPHPQPGPHPHPQPGPHPHPQPHP